MVDILYFLLLPHNNYYHVCFLFLRKKNCYIFQYNNNGNVLQLIFIYNFITLAPYNFLFFGMGDNGEEINEMKLIITFLCLNFWFRRESAGRSKDHLASTKLYVICISTLGLSPAGPLCLTCEGIAAFGGCGKDFSEE